MHILESNLSKFLNEHANVLATVRGEGSSITAKIAFLRHLLRLDSWMHMSLYEYSHWYCMVMCVYCSVPVGEETIQVLNTYMYSILFAVNCY